MIKHDYSSNRHNELLGTENCDKFKDKPLVEIECADLIVETLADLGAKIAFGIPGGALSNIFNSLSKSTEIRTVLTQHETGAAYMAMGRTLVSLSKRELGVCFATSGPGITNLITGIASAFEERNPIFVLTGNVATHLVGRGAAQDAHPSGINAVKMLEPITCRSLTVMTTEGIEEIIRELYQEALETRLPVHLNIPTDVATTVISADERSSGSYSPKPTRAVDLSSDEEIRDSMTNFLNSERPLIFAGNGIKTSGLSHLLKNCIECLQLPLILTSHAKGAISDDHPLYFGNFGFAANERATDFLKTYDPDAILFLGTRLTEPSSAGWSPLLKKPKHKIHVDLDRKQLNRIYQVDEPICADLNNYLTKLLAEGPSKVQSTYQLNRIAAQLSLANKQNPSLQLDGPINPQSLMQIMDLWIPEDCVIFSDIGNSMAWILNSLPIREGQELHIPIGLGSMGSGICGAIGAKSVLDNRPVICFTGDCTMLMHGTEIFSALNAGIGIGGCQDSCRLI